MSGPLGGSFAKASISAGAFVLVTLVMVPAAWAQSVEEVLRNLQREVQALQEGQARLQRDLEEIKQLLRTRPAAARPAEAPLPARLALGDGPVKGSPTTRLVLLEFTDYQCPFCARHVRNTAGRIDAEYVQTGKLRYTLRDFPLESIHPQAFKAAEAAHCAGEQARYWEMHGQLFANQGKLGAEDLAAHAQAVGLDVARMTACLEAGRYAARVRQGLADGEQAGVRGTPTFFLGEIEADGAGIKPLAVLRGAQPFSAFKAAIDSALAASR